MAVRRSTDTPPVLGPMIAGSLEHRWRVFAKELARNRRRCTEQSIHDLRVATRRLMAIVDIVRMVLPDDGLGGARKTLRRHLRAFNELRDVHIQILAVRVLVRQFPVLRPHLRGLRLRQGALVRQAARTVARIETARLEKALAGEAARVLSLLNLPRMNAVGTATVVGAMSAAFARAIDLRQKVTPADPGTVHRLRVAFKKCRYMTEALSPLLPHARRRVLKAMNAYQTRMGEIQDMQVIAAGVNRFALRTRRAPNLPLVAVQQYLALRRKEQIDAFLSQADDLYPFWGPPSCSALTSPAPTRAGIPSPTRAPHGTVRPPPRHRRAGTRRR